MRLLGNIIKRSFKIARSVQAIRLLPIDQQHKTFKRLLKKAQNTAFGKHYDFESILNAPTTEAMIQQFQAKIPLHDYDSMHDKWWYRSLQNEPDVTWPGKIQYFALSSGTTGSPSKHIPVTKEMIRAMRRAGMKVFFSLTRYNINPDMYTKDNVMLGGSTSLKDKGGYFVGDLSGINISQRPFWIRGVSKPEGEIAAIADWEMRLQRIAERAKDWDVAFISGIPSWNQLMIEKIVEYHKVKDIHEIWPNLTAFVHGGISFEPHRRSFEAMMRKPMVYVDTYLASEGFIAYQNRPETRSMELLTNNGIFFEFIPFNDANFDGDGNLKGQPKTLTVNDVTTDVDYALVLSTCAGAWRYLIGDTVRFTDFRRKEIVITGRTKHFLSVCGEHLSVGNMNSGIEYVQKILNTKIREFTVCAVVDKGSYAHRWYVGCDPQVDAAQFGSLLDGELCRINDDYATERTSVLHDIQMHIVPPNLFIKWMESKGKMGGQHKFPRVMKKNDFAEWEAFVAKSLEMS
jgi:GH3 auxin-responsive promoter